MVSAKAEFFVASYEARKKVNSSQRSNFERSVLKSARALKKPYMYLLKFPVLYCYCLAVPSRRQVLKPTYNMYISVHRNLYCVVRYSTLAGVPSYGPQILNNLAHACSQVIVCPTHNLFFYSAHSAL